MNRKDFTTTEFAEALAAMRRAIHEFKEDRAAVYGLIQMLLRHGQLVANEPRKREKGRPVPSYRFVDGALPDLFRAFGERLEKALERACSCTLTGGPHEGVPGPLHAAGCAAHTAGPPPDWVDL